MRARYLVSAVLAVLVLGGLWLAIVWHYGHGPFAAPGIVETRHEPEVMRELGEGGDPLVVMVGYFWPEDGYCSGQFHVSAIEGAAEVRVGTVISRLLTRDGGCAGLGTSSNRAWAELRLVAPLGNRRVVRDSDGAPLPFVSLFP